jgi:hypothetical protein
LIIIEQSAVLIGCGVIWNWHGRLAREGSQPREAVKQLNFEFLAIMLSASYRQNNRLFSINPQLQMAVPQQMTPVPTDLWYFPNAKNCLRSGEDALRLS